MKQVYAHKAWSGINRIPDVGTARDLRLKSLADRVEWLETQLTVATKPDTKRFYSEKLLQAQEQLQAAITAKET